MQDIRKFMDLMELDLAPSSTAARDADGRVMHQDVQYEVTTDKVVAQLSSYQSQVYTKLGQKLQRIQQLSDEVDTLKEEVKAETKEHIADLFSASDVVRTRVINTVSFTFTLSKNPKPTESYKYADIVKALEKDATPELMKRLTELKAQFKTITEKSPSLKYDAVTKESVQINEGFWDKISAWALKFKEAIFNWAMRFDQKLESLEMMKARIDAVQESVVDLGGFMGIGKKDTALAQAREVMMNEDDEVELAYGGQYMSLTDKYPSGETQIWYAKDPRAARMEKPDASELEKNYVMVGTVQPDDLEYVFDMMQGDKWSPRGEARNFIKKLGLTHTSMMVGDVIVADGVAYYVAPMGFKRLQNKGSMTAEDFNSFDMTFEDMATEYDSTVRGESDTMALSVGDTVYCGSFEGTLVKDQVPGHPDVALVRIGSEIKPFKKSELTTKKPGLMKRAASWIVGEDEVDSDEFADELDEEIEARDLVWTRDYTTWFENKKRIEGLNVVKQEKYKIWVANPHDEENPLLVAEWQPTKRQGYIDVSVLPVISKRQVRLNMDDSND